MKTRHRILAGISLAGAAALLAAAPGWTQASSGPVARYTIDAGTTSGMAAMGAGGGVGAALGALRGGGNQVVHELYLRLGSSRAPTGEAKGDRPSPARCRCRKAACSCSGAAASAPGRGSRW